MITRAGWIGIDKNWKQVKVAEIEISSAKEYSDKEIIYLEIGKRIIPVILLEYEKKCFKIMKLQSIANDNNPDGYHYTPKGNIMRVYDFDMLKELLG